MTILNTRLTTTALTTVFTASGQQAITVIYFTNTTGSTVIIDVHVFNNGGTATDSNMILSALAITANDTYIMSAEKLILANLDLIQVIADTSNAITVTISSIAV